MRGGELSAAGQLGIVASVAVPRQGDLHPTDDVIVGIDHAGKNISLELQVNKEIFAAAVKTQAAANFIKSVASGFVVEHVTDSIHRTTDFADHGAVHACSLEGTGERG